MFDALVEGVKSMHGQYDADTLELVFAEPPHAVQPNVESAGAK